MTSTILIVDDKPDHVCLLEALLSGHGYLVETAPHGAEALAIARQRRPDLCITDLRMPVMDGYTLLRHWKADAHLQNVPMMVYTATGTDAEGEHLARQMGADAVLVKPTEPEALVAAVQQVLARRPGAAIRHLDIAGRRRIEEESREAAARLSLAVDAAQIGIWELQADGTLVWNQVMHAIYAVPPDVTPTMDLWATLVSEADRPALRAGMTELSAQGGRAERRFTTNSLDGVQRHVFGVVKLLPGVDGAPDKLIGTHIDITERTRQDLALQAVNARMETLIAEARIGILVQRDRKALMANEALARILGLPSRAEVMALTSFENFFDIDQRRSVAAVWDALMAGQPAAEMIALKGQRADGAALEVELRAFCIEWDDGRAVCSMITDVTEQRAVEAQLRQAQRLEAVGQLTGGVAHDFNNLLTVILGNAELLEEELADAPFQRRLAGMIVRAAERGADLARHLLAFSRRQHLDPGNIDINAMLVTMADFLRRAIGPTILLDVRLTTGPCAAVVDLAQLENALLNLAVNARDAMPTGGALTITTHHVPPQDQRFDRPPDLAPGPHVMVAVADTGCGMDDQTRLRAFEPFFTTKDVGKGSGLGLSMVYGFVKQSRGAVQIRSTPGEGATVELWLPRATGAADASPDRPLGPALPAGTEHVLVAEDDPMVRAQVVAQLETLGYRVTSAGNGVEALALLRQDTAFDLLFTDIVMPGGLNGHALAAAALALRPGLAILLTSGFADRAERPAGTHDQEFPMLGKPYRREDLAIKVRDAIDRAPSA